MLINASELYHLLAKSHCYIWCLNRASIHLSQVGVMTSESGEGDNEDEDDEDADT